MEAQWCAEVATLKEETFAISRFLAKSAKFFKIPHPRKFLPAIFSKSRHARKFIRAKFSKKKSASANIHFYSCSSRDV